MSTVTARDTVKTNTGQKGGDMRKIMIIAVALVFVTATAFASHQYKPGIGETDVYAHGLPTWAQDPDNIVTSMSESIQMLFGSEPISGTVNSWVYTNPVADGGDGFNTFVYEFVIDSGGPVVRASMGGAAWQGVTITDQGTDGDTATKSTPATDTPNWDDGDPYFIQRLGGGGIAMQFEDADVGTLLGPGNRSNLIWFHTEFEDWDTAFVGLINGGVTAGAPVLAPKQLEMPPNGVPIPEPTGLMAMGLLALVGRKRRK